MSMNIVRGNEMRLVRIKIVGMMGAILICASAQVTAGVCEAERQAANRLREASRSNPWTRPSVTPGDLQKALVGLLSQGPTFHPSMGKGNTTIRSVYPDAPDNPQALKDWAMSLEYYLRSNRQAGDPEAAVRVANIQEMLCLISARKTMLEGGGAGSLSASRPPSGIPSTNRPTPTNQTSANQKYDDPDEALADIRQSCSREIEAYRSSLGTGYGAAQIADISDGHIRSAISAPKEVLEKAFTVANGLGSTPLLVSYNSCLFKRRIWQLERRNYNEKPVSSNAPIAARSDNSPSSGPPTNATPSANTSQEAQRMNAQLNEAVARAEKRQAVVDRARQGKPKRHIEGSVAHQCLTLIPHQDSLYGGFINSCRYAVEYVYCAYKPKKDSWVEAFDCEKGKFGSWHVGPGPNNRSGVHTKNAERIYYFACRYGETLHKPDGISIADIEFQTGRGLLGRCTEWGSGGK